MAAGITIGPLWHKEGERLDRYFFVVDDAACRCAVARIVGKGGDIHACLEIGLRGTK